MALASVVIAVLLACGGGGGAPTNPNPDPGPFTQIRLEAVSTTTGQFVDPTNIFTNESITFRLSGINSNNQRVVISTSGWGITGVNAGVLQSNGNLVASANPTGVTGTVSVTYDTIQYSGLVRVVSPQAILTGRIRLITGTLVGRVGIHCLNSSGTVVATGMSAADGSVRLSVPTTAVRFRTDYSIVDPAATFYVRQFAYNGRDYSTSISSCTAALPTLVNNAITNFVTDVVVYSSQDFQNPPPPPNGCG